MLTEYQGTRLKIELINARASIKEAAAVIARDGSRKAGRERALRILNDSLVKLRTLEIELDKATLAGV